MTATEGGASRRGGDMIWSRGDLETYIEEHGIVPFFRCGAGWRTIEDMTPADIWFVKGVEGPWDWKGPIAMSGKAAYGKFILRTMAAFVRKDLFWHLMNYRRSKYQMTPDMQEILRTIEANESLLSTEVRDMCGYGKAESRVEMLFSDRPAKKGFDGIINKLQYGTYIVIEDFEYKHDKKGRPYGWGIARYTTPEIKYAGEIEKPRISPEESLRYIVEEVVRTTEGVTEEEIRRCLS